jgi:hypothetical protein
VFLYVIIVYNMQKRDKLDKLSQQRSALRQAIERLGQTLEIAFERDPIVKGNVYELARKCGKPSCACAEGQLHRSMVLSWSEGGKTRLLSIPAERLEELRRKSERYLRFRTARAQVTVLCRQILALLDRIEKLRREKP